MDGECKSMSEAIGRITPIHNNDEVYEKFSKEKSKDITKFGLIITGMVVFFLTVGFIL